MAERILELPIVLLYAYCICYAIVSDIRELRVPNWIPIALVLGFAPYAIWSWNELQLPMRLVVVAIIFCISFIFYYMRLLGGGDVKLLSSISLWVAPVDILAFVILMGLIGAALALALMLMRKLFGRDGPLARVRVPPSVARCMRQGVCPYGAAIGLAGLVMLPKIFD